MVIIQLVIIPGVILTTQTLVVFRSEKLPTIPREPKFHIPQHKKIKSCMSWNDMYIQQAAGVNDGRR